jgi:hypothetical protein
MHNSVHRLPLGLPDKGLFQISHGNVGDLLVQPSRDARSPLVWVPKPGLRNLVAQICALRSSSVQQSDRSDWCCATDVTI